MVNNYFIVTAFILQIGLQLFNKYVKSELSFKVSFLNKFSV